MKKFLLVLLVVSLVAVSIFAVACQKEEVEELKSEYTIVAPDGAPAIAISTFIRNTQVTEEYKVTASVVAAANVKNEVIKSDFAVVPANMAAILYNQQIDYKVIASVTNGNLFFVAKNQENDFTLENMKGKVLYAIGQNNVPGLIVLSLLAKNNIEYEISETPVEGKVAIHYCTDGAQVIQKLTLSEGQAYGVVPEPALTVFKINNKCYQMADIQELWQSATSASVKGFAQAVLIARGKLCKDHPEVVESVVKAIEDSEEYVITNAQDVATEIASAGGSTMKLFPISVQNSNVKVYRAKDYAQYIETTLNALKDVDAQSVGGSVPAKDSGFYYL